MRLSVQEKEFVEIAEATDEAELKNLVVFNDDVNTFDHVIETLVKVCKHTREQAEQCAMIVHHRGKCSVKSGAMDELKPMRDAICDRGIDARII
jgi:ATP-dependent Clp protease adaptor protein ClpS